MYTSRALPLPSLTVTIFLLFLVFNTLATGQTTTQVTVTSDPLWTDTHLSLKAGQTIAINASGSWNWGQAQANFGPDGDPSTPFGYYGDEFEGFDLVDHGRLIGFVGPDPYQGNWRNSAFFPQTSGYLSIGSGETFTTPYGGELWLGFNDDAVAGGVNDNTGQVVANITEGNRDITGPSISIGAPSNYYLLNQKVAAKYSCSDPDDAVATCAGPVATGADIDTSFAGTHAFTVVATDSHGNTSTRTLVYQVGDAGVSPALVDFLPQYVGSSSAAQKVTLFNPQAVALSVSSISVSGNFTDTTNCPSSLAAHSSCTIDITLTPAAAGVNSGLLAVNDSVGTQYAGLLGFGTPVKLTPGALSFGDQKVGTTSAAKKVVLTNGQTVALSIYSINTTVDFALSSKGTCPDDGTLAAGATCAAAITFKPTVAGARSGELIFRTSYPSAPIVVPFSGTGTP